VDKVQQSLAEGDHEIRFPWINKRDWGEYLPTDNADKRDVFNLNIELFLVMTYVHEWYHAEGANLPMDSLKEEEVVLQRESSYLKKHSVKELRNMARHIEAHYLLPHLLKKHAPHLRECYDKITKEKSRQKRKSKPKRIRKK